MTDPKKSTKFWSWPHLRGRIIASALIAAGAIHAFKPQWIALDWPTIVLIGLGVLLFIIPLDDLGNIVESLEVGKTKILFRKVRELDESVRAAEAAEDVIPPPAQLPVLKTQPEAAVDAPVEVPTYSRVDATATPEDAKKNEDVDAGFRGLSEHAPRLALLRIEVELEKVIAELCEVTTGKSYYWKHEWIAGVGKLELLRVISIETAQALHDFHDVRNQIIHTRGNQAPEAVVTSAINSGLDLLRLLRGILKDYETLKQPG